MPDKQIDIIRALVRKGDYYLSSHIVDEICQGEFEREDVEFSVLCGEIVESQRDEKKCSLNNRKYTILGRTQSGLLFESVGKLIADEAGRKYFFITAYDWN